MKQTLSVNKFHYLVDSLKRPLPLTQTESYWPYPLPEAEMIARYGLRRLTDDEKQIFPGLCLVLQIYKDPGGDTVRPRWLGGLGG